VLPKDARVPSFFSSFLQRPHLDSFFFYTWAFFLSSAGVTSFFLQIPRENPSFLSFCRHHRSLLFSGGARHFFVMRRRLFLLLLKSAVFQGRELAYSFLPQFRSMRKVLFPLFSREALPLPQCERDLFFSSISSRMLTLFFLPHKSRRTTGAAPKDQSPFSSRRRSSFHKNKVVFFFEQPC